jgi:F-type H+-transporting ATPase subunit a
VSSSQQLGDAIGRHAWWWFGWQPRPTGFFSLLLDVDTIIMTVIVIIIILALALIARRNMSLERPTGVQNVLEMVVEFIGGFVTDTLGDARGASVAPIAITLFVFILVCNYIGLLPIPSYTCEPKTCGIPVEFGWHSPTSDLNTTAGLALMVFFYLQWVSIRAHHGVGGWLRHTLLSHGVAFAPISLVEELTRPLTLAFRLFGNIFAGEVLILVFAVLLPAVFVSVPHLFALFLAIFVGAIQAFIFTMLTIAYVGIATSTDEAH